MRTKRKKPARSLSPPSSFDDDDSLVPQFSKKQLFCELKKTLLLCNRTIVATSSSSFSFAQDIMQLFSPRDGSNPFTNSDSSSFYRRKGPNHWSKQVNKGESRTKKGGEKPCWMYKAICSLLLESPPKRQRDHRTTIRARRRSDRRTERKIQQQRQPKEFRENVWSDMISNYPW